MSLAKTYQVKKLVWRSNQVQLNYEYDVGTRGETADGYAQVMYFQGKELWFRYSPVQRWKRLEGTTAQEHYEIAIRKHLVEEGADNGED